MLVATVPEAREALTEEADQEKVLFEMLDDSALFTGVAYMVTVVLLVAPFLIVDDHRVAVAITLAVAVLLVAVFTTYLSVARGLPFRRRCLEMAGISLGVAAVSFGIGIGIKHLLGVAI